VPANRIGGHVLHHPDQFVEIDRLRHVAAEARREHMGTIRFSRIGSHRNHRHVAEAAIAALFQRLEERVAILSRHPDIRDDRVRPHSIEQTKRLLS
jgi:hypothetical protein